MKRIVTKMLSLLAAVAVLASCTNSNTVYQTTTHQSITKFGDGRVDVSNIKVDWYITNDTCIMKVEGLKPVHESRRFITYDPNSNTIVKKMKTAYQILWK